MAEMIKYICDNCGKDCQCLARHYRRRMKISKSGKLFCSTSCQHKSLQKNTTISLICKSCGKHFTRRKSYYIWQMNNRSNSKAVYCSQECYGIGITKCGKPLPIKKIIKEYNKGCNSTQLSKKYGCSHSTIFKILKTNNIFIRNISEALLTPTSRINQSYACALKASRKNGYKMNISKKYINDLLEKQNFLCALTGTKMLIRKKNHDKSYGLRNPLMASLDRINSSKGYLRGNVQWVTWEVNQMKHDLSESRLIKLAKLIVQNDKKKQKTKELV